MINDMHIKQLNHASGSLWQQAMEIYCNVFPQWERESEADLVNAVNSGKTRAIVICQEQRVLGMTLTELYPQHSFAMLGYLFIAPTHQGQGLGKLLCDEMFDTFDNLDGYDCLLVEAEAGPARFYQKLGFDTFDFDYWSPHYDDDQATQMALMYHVKQGQQPPSYDDISKMVHHIYCHSYYLSQQDPRLTKQLNIIQAKEDQ